MKQEYRHTRPYRGKDPTFAEEELYEHEQNSSHQLSGDARRQEQPEQASRRAMHEQDQHATLHAPVLQRDGDGRRDRSQGKARDEEPAETHGQG